jgi:dipeptidyl aminopeptidase/acylaminoacyl peptidase
MGYLRSQRVLFTAVALCALVTAAGCGEESPPRATPSAGDPPGFLLYLVEHEEPACPDPCDDEDPPAGAQTAWIETVRGDGTGLRRVSCVWANPTRCDGEGHIGGHQPRISPSGRFFATSDGPGTVSTDFAHVRVHDLDGRVVDRLRVPGNPKAVSWSPDERYLAVTTDRPHGAPLYLVPRSGGRYRLLRRNGGWLTDWSRKGLLAGALQPLGVFRSDGRMLYRLTRVKSAFDWSPSGHLLAFGCRGQAICAVRYDGRRRRVLTRRCSAGTYSPLAWSPDGRWIACTRSQELVAVRLSDDAVRVIREQRPRDAIYDVDWGGG